MNKLGGSIGMTLQGFYKVAIVDKDGKEIWRQPEWGHNLILNQGMDGVMSYYLNTLSYIGIAGIGTRTNTISSGDSIGSAINGEVFLTPVTGLQNFSSSIVNDWTGSLWSGDTIKFADGTIVTATGSRPNAVVLGDFSASINSGATIASQSFTIYKTAATGLHREVKRAGGSIATSSYLAGANGTVVSAASASVTHTRTYDFGSESIDRTYTEIGVGWSSTGWSSSSFARVLLPIPVTALQDQRLRLIYSLMTTFSPTGSVYMINAPISGWPVAPATNTNLTQSIQIFQAGGPGDIPGSLSCVNTDGSTTAENDAGLEPVSSGGNCYVWVSSNSQSLTPFAQYPTVDRGHPASMSYYGATIVPYQRGTYECYKYITLGLNDMNIDKISTFGFGGYQNRGYSADYTSWNQECAFTCRFDQHQTKYNTQTLTLNFKWSWNRVLE